MMSNNEMDMLKTHLDRISEVMNHVSDLSYDELVEEYKNRINAASELGMNGWTVNPSKTPIDVMEWIDTISLSGEQAIAYQYTDNDIEEMFNSLEYLYNDNSAGLYLRHSIESYHSERYTDAAMFLLALLDNRIFHISPEKYAYSKKKQINKGIIENEQEYHNRSNKKMAKVFLECDYVPSIISYSLRVFIDSKGHECFTGDEPPFLNRNWLLHGRMSREVEKYEVIQIINAISTVAEIENILAET